MIKETLFKFLKYFLCKFFGKNIQELENLIQNLENLLDKYVNFAIPNAQNFVYKAFRDKVLSYVNSLYISENEYLFCEHQEKSCVYNTVYQLLIYSLLGNEHVIDKKNVKSYLDSFQSADGFFYDSKLEDSPYWETQDWWGKKHLLSHICMVYSILGLKPKYEFEYVKKFYEKQYRIDFLENIDLKNVDVVLSDFDNAIFNICTTLQFQRDFFNDSNASAALDDIFNWLDLNVDCQSGSWGYCDENNMEAVSRLQQIAYHIYAAYIYDDRVIPHANKIIDLTLKVQNKFGGFSSQLCASACEDMDAVFLLVMLERKYTKYRNDDVNEALKKVFRWYFVNQNENGGFVFRKNESFPYGHQLMTSVSNESNLFATWFRSLAIAYITKYLGINNDFIIKYCPGCSFW